jgi:hypothetical protein
MLSIVQKREEFLIVFERLHTVRNQAGEPAGIGTLSQCQVTDACLIVRPVGVHRANYHPVAKDKGPYEGVGVEFRWPLAARDPGNHQDAVLCQRGDRLEGQRCEACRFEDEVKRSVRLRQLGNGCMLRADVASADGFSQFCV